MNLRQPELTLTVPVVSVPARGNAPRATPMSPTDHFKPLRNSCVHRAFTLIELLIPIALIGILIGTVGPAVNKVRIAAIEIQATRDLHELCLAMDQVFDADGDYPLDIADPRLLPFLSEGLVHRIDQSIHAEYPDSPRRYPFYYIISVRSGGDGKGTWDFRIASGTGENPTYQDNGSYARAASFYDLGVTVDPAGKVAQSLIQRDGVWISAANVDDTAGDYFWPWNKAQPKPSQSRYNLSLALVTARGAEMVTPLLEAHPEIAGHVRAYLQNPETTTLVLSQFDPAWFAPFNDILRLTDDEIHDLSDMDLTNLQGDPAYLFSYESLRVLSTLYSNHDGVTLGLVAKLDAAEAAETRGNLTAKRGQINAFQDQVRAQTGKALNGAQSRTMLAVSRVLIPQPSFEPRIVDLSLAIQLLVDRAVAFPSGGKKLLSLLDFAAKAAAVNNVNGVVSSLRSFVSEVDFYLGTHILSLGQFNFLKAAAEMIIKDIRAYN
ncbi:MAG: type II secretion system protein [Planctomycetia bacterium]|nr:type II secretion system protein [Planctomycetia bacterium]